MYKKLLYKYMKILLKIIFFGTRTGLSLIVIVTYINNEIIKSVILFKIKWIIIIFTIFKIWKTNYDVIYPRSGRFFGRHITATITAVEMTLKNTKAIYLRQLLGSYMYRLKGMVTHFV